MSKLAPVMMLVVALLVIGFAGGYLIGLVDGDKKEQPDKPAIVQTVVQTSPPVIITTTPAPMTPQVVFEVPPSSPEPTRTPRPTIDYSQLPTVGVECGNHRTCGGMSNCEHVFACYYDGRGRLDGDSDGVPCEEICPGVLYAPRGYPIPFGYPSPTFP